jgi:FSR family fosmidomycin resistance protein-like MFS transporter
MYAGICRTPIRGASARSSAYAVLSRRKVLFAIGILVALLFSKNVYTSSLSSYYTFYLIHKFGLSVQDAQIHLFVFLGAVAAGTFAGGPIGDRFGRKPVIWFSIVGAFPFALALPYAGLLWTGILSVAIGLSWPLPSPRSWSMRRTCYRDGSAR